MQRSLRGTRTECTGWKPRHGSWWWWQVFKKGTLTIGNHDQPPGSQWSDFTQWSWTTPMFIQRHGTRIHQLRNAMSGFPKSSVVNSSHVQLFQILSPAFALLALHFHSAWVAQGFLPNCIIHWCAIKPPDWALQELPTKWYKHARYYLAVHVTCYLTILGIPSEI